MRDQSLKKVVHTDSGVALVFVLWVIVILGVVAGQFCYSMRQEVNSARYRKDAAEAYYIAYAGISAVLHAVGDPDLEIGKKEFRVNIPSQPVVFAGGSYQLALGNESGKVNINYADRDLLKFLLDAFNLEEADRDVIIDSILDWRDKDALHRMNGAENDYYMSLASPYRCRDGLFRSVDELLRVRGVTEELYYRGLKDLVSVVIINSSKKDDNKGRGRININAASPEMLSLFLGMTPQAIEKFYAARMEKDIDGFSALVSGAGITVPAAVRKYIGFENNRYFTVESTGRTGEGLSPQIIRAMVRTIKTNEKGVTIVQWLDNVVPLW